MINAPILQRATTVGTMLQLTMVVLGHYIPWVRDNVFMFGGMLISGVAGLLYARDAALGYGRGALGGADCRRCLRVDRYCGVGAAEGHATFCPRVGYRHLGPDRRCRRPLGRIRRAPEGAAEVKSPARFPERGFRACVANDSVQFTVTANGVEPIPLATTCKVLAPVSIEAGTSTCVETVALPVATPIVL